MNKNTRKERKIKMSKIHICWNTKLITKFSKNNFNISFKTKSTIEKILTKNC